MSIEYNLPVIKQKPILFKQYMQPLIPIKRKVSFTIKSELNNISTEISTSQSLQTKEFKQHSTCPCQKLIQNSVSTEIKDDFIEQYQIRRQIMKQTSSNNVESLTDEYELFKYINTASNEFKTEQIYQFKQIITSQTLELKGCLDKCEACNCITEYVQLQLDALNANIMMSQQQIEMMTK
ncbi:Hypothetical_protein [Hexamita inflata]|uniref:Hypothetical_protein n=1 Tax=Hexamita inflata TaxID=28002 RepID=A0AA86U309_9EUKA|nr:Hypothetical protein HINF_LOCUS26219 [Hexamita inflata]